MNNSKPSRVVLAVFFGPWYQGPDNGTRALVRRSFMVNQSPTLNGLGATGLRCYQGVLPGSFLKLVSGIQLCRNYYLLWIYFDTII